MCCTLSGYQRIQHIRNLQKRHNCATAQIIFNRFCQNQITISWHIHLRICTESFIKFVQKLWEIYGKTNVSTFFWTRCIIVYTVARSSVWVPEVVQHSSTIVVVVVLVARSRHQLINVHHSRLVCPTAAASDFEKSSSAVSWHSATHRLNLLLNRQSAVAQWQH